MLCDQAHTYEQAVAVNGLAMDDELAEYRDTWTCPRYTDQVCE